MKRAQADERSRVIRYMYRTARANGKQISYGRVIAVADRLHRLEKTLERLAYDEACEPEYDMRKQERIEKLATKVVTEEIGCRVRMNRDPRGYCIRMYLQDYFNSWDGETTGLAW